MAEIAMKLKGERIKRGRGEAIAMWIAFAIFVLYSFTLIYPFIWLLLNSFKDNLSIRTDTFGLPKKWLVSNYAVVFKEYNIGNMFYNSITLTVGCSLASLVATTIAAYCMSKYKFKGKAFIHTFIILSMTIPTLGALPATYKLMIDTKLFGSYLGMLLMSSGAFGGHYLYLYAFFKGVSWSYAESAMLDGANNFQIFVKIMLPMAMPMVITVGVLKAIGCWNEYWMPYLFYQSHPTLAVGLYFLQVQAAQIGEYAKLFAAMMVATVPIIVFFIAFQKQIMGISIGGGLKG